MFKILCICEIDQKNFLKTSDEAHFEIGGHVKKLIILVARKMYQ